MPIYEQTPIRLNATLVGNPPVPPVDDNTGAAPKFWRASSVGIAVGIFDAMGNPVDLTNLVASGKLQLFLFKNSSDLVPLFAKEIDGADLMALITTAAWQDGSQQNALFILDPADTDQGLAGAAQADFWLVLNGVTDTQSEVLYAAGPVTIFNASKALPVAASITPSRHAQELDAGNITVTPTSNIHLEVVTVGGAGARTSNIIVGQAGLTDGARIDVLVLAPAAPGAIDIEFFVGSLAGANPFAFNTSGGTTRALFKFYFDGALLQPLEVVNPAY